MSTSPTPNPGPSSDRAAFAHPSMSLANLSDFPGHRLGPSRRRTWRNRRQAWLGAGDHGSATLLNAHRPEPTTSPPAA